MHLAVGLLGGTLRLRVPVRNEVLRCDAASSPEIADGAQWRRRGSVRPQLSRPHRRESAGERRAAFLPDAGCHDRAALRFAPAHAQPHRRIHSLAPQPRHHSAVRPQGTPHAPHQGRACEALSRAFVAIALPRRRRRRERPANGPYGILRPGVRFPLPKPSRPPQDPLPHPRRGFAEGGAQAERDPWSKAPGPRLGPYRRCCSRLVSGSAFRKSNIQPTLRGLRARVAPSLKGSKQCAEFCVFD